MLLVCLNLVVSYLCFEYWCTAFFIMVSHICMFDQSYAAKPRQRYPTIVFFCCLMGTVGLAKLRHLCVSSQFHHLTVGTPAAYKLCSVLWHRIVKSAAVKFTCFEGQAWPEIVLKVFCSWLTRGIVDNTLTKAHQNTVIYIIIHVFINTYQGGWIRRCEFAALTWVLGSFYRMRN